MAMQHHLDAGSGHGNMDDYRQVYASAQADPQAFWSARATELLAWHRTWDTVLDETAAPFYRWFVGGELNASFNCLDRQDPTRLALTFEGEPGDTTNLHLWRTAGRGVPRSQRPQGPGGGQGRPRGHLYAVDPGGMHCHACLRPTGGNAHGDLRRLQRGGRA